MLRRTALALLSLVALTAGSAHAADWGTLKGRFIHDGPAPAPKQIGQDNDNCKNHKVLDETVVVGAGGGLANVVVFLRTEKPAVHPSYESTAKAEVTLDNNKCHFVPHVTLLRSTQTLVVKNSDGFGHNTNLSMVKNTGGNNLIPPGGQLKITNLKDDESVLCQVTCNIHSFMGGRILVRSNPYMAASNDKGEFEIKDLPAGKELEFQFAHENPGFLKNVAIKGVSGGKTDTRGRTKIKITKGVVDLGDIKVPAALVARRGN